MANQTAYTLKVPTVYKSRFVYLYLVCTSGVTVCKCSTRAGTEKMCMRNMLVNFSVKPAAIRGRRAKVTMADKEACLKAILARPRPLRRSFYKSTSKNKKGYLCYLIMMKKLDNKSYRNITVIIGKVEVMLLSQTTVMFILVFFSLSYQKQT